MSNQGKHHRIRNHQMHLQDQLRNMSMEQLEDLLPFPVSEFKTVPYRHQLASFLALLSKPGYMGALEMGLGKTKVVIDVCDFLLSRKHVNRILVVAANSTLENFGRQLETHSRSTYTILRGANRDARMKKAREGNTNYHIINYEGLPVMGAGWAEKIDDDGNLKKKRRLAQKLIDQFAAFYDVIVFDDSHALKSPRSISSKIAYRLACQMSYRYCLTGTPYGKDLMDIFQQLTILDMGETFGTDNWFHFRNWHFRPYGPYAWKVKDASEPKILDAYHEHSIRFEESECYDLPDVISPLMEYEMSNTQARAYNQLSSDEDFETGGIHISTENRFGKYRQILSGGLLHKGKLVRTFEPNPKLELCIDIIEQAIPHYKVLVFNDFIFEAHLIEAILRKKGIQYASMRSEIKSNNDEYLRFQNDESVRVMIAHPKSGGVGLDFVNCAICIFYSTPLDIINRKQCEKRILRQNQKSKRIWYYDFCARNSVEVSILQALRNGRDFHTRTLTRPAFDKILRGGGLSH